MKLPFISRKKHEAGIISIRENYARQRREAERQTEQRIKEITKELETVLHNLVNVSVVYDKGSTIRPWRLVLDMDAVMITSALERGNDDYMIEYIADSIKYRVMRELKSVNIQRPEDLRLGRLPRFGD